MSAASVSAAPIDAAPRAAAKPLLTLRGIETFYGKIQALKGIDLDVNEGEIVTLIGANGAGKSTTMMTIFGSPRARRGTITFSGRDITGLPPHQIARFRKLRGRAACARPANCCVPAATRIRMWCGSWRMRSKSRWTRCAA